MLRGEFWAELDHQGLVREPKGRRNECKNNERNWDRTHRVMVKIVWHLLNRMCNVEG